MLSGGAAGLLIGGFILILMTASANVLGGTRD
jgi:hypothetical protein